MSIASNENKIKMLQNLWNGEIKTIGMNENGEKYPGL